MFSRSERDGGFLGLQHTVVPLRELLQPNSSRRGREISETTRELLQRHHYQRRSIPLLVEFETDDLKRSRPLPVAKDALR
ncbi:hypothetical protein BG842_04290 [Haladaptatus sp. W1]|uniref:hypothetical protein n=1 Tax=Haladaptatus sp. W1 TaxID=1897478 RepID=UPI0008499D90|nr:hypothetical protein [Haladaptatus sp. W1]ODR81528.1 hypothetical protein BG842_04290 [Haladaptatus sp. W1]